MSQPGFIYIFAFKKCENLHFYKPTFDSSGWQGSEVNEEDCVAVLENKRKPAEEGDGLFCIRIYFVGIVWSLTLDDLRHY